MANKFANRLPNRATAHGAGRPAAGDYTVVTRLNTSRGFANPTPLLDERTWGQRLENQSAERTKTGPAVRLVEGQMAQHDARTPGLPLDAETPHPPAQARRRAAMPASVASRIQ